MTSDLSILQEILRTIYSEWYDKYLWNISCKSCDWCIFSREKLTGTWYLLTSDVNSRCQLVIVQVVELLDDGGCLVTQRLRFVVHDIFAWISHRKARTYATLVIVLIRFKYKYRRHEYAYIRSHITRTGAHTYMSDINDHKLN